MSLLTVLSVLLIKYYAQNVDPAIHLWFESLRSEAGAYCCAETDGIKLDDPSWELTPQGYVVTINGKKLPVPPTALVHRRNPSVNYAVVWVLSGEIRCFLPGTVS